MSCHFTETMIAHRAQRLLDRLESAMGTGYMETNPDVELLKVASWNCSPFLKAEYPISRILIQEMLFWVKILPLFSAWQIQAKQSKSVRICCAHSARHGNGRIRDWTALIQLGWLL